MKWDLVTEPDEVLDEMGLTVVEVLEMGLETAFDRPAFNICKHNRSGPGPSIRGPIAG